MPSFVNLGAYIDSGTMTIKDSQNQLIGRSTGITRAWLYRDNGTTSQVYDSSDTFVSSTNDFTDSKFIISI